MRAIKAILALSLLVAGAAAFAQADDALAAGSWEFGGSLKFSHFPMYPVLAGDLTKSETGDNDFVCEVTASIGKFLADGFSLAIRPEVLYYSRHRLNSSLQKSKSRYLMVEVGVEPSWYLPLGSSWLLGLGAEVGMGFVPGLPGMEDNIEESDKSFYVLFSLEPKVRGYFLATESLAPYAEMGYRLWVQRRILDTNGDPYNSSTSIIDDTQGRFAFTLGIKFFLPHGARFEETRLAPLSETMEKGFLD